MSCYRDMTFCKYYLQCEKGDGCVRALTKTIEKDAEEFGLPTSFFGSPPDCFEMKGK